LGVEIPEGYLVPSVYTSPDTAAEHTKRLLSLPDPPTCIIYPDDISYIGGMNQIEKMGLRIPEDISAAGYDGADVSQMLRPRLTTVRQDADRMGELAADELLRAVEEGRSYVPGRILVPGELIPGQTVKDLDL
jgi:LacI family transcriptional regulator